MRETRLWSLHLLAIPIILVPTETRLNAIMQVWRGAWPDGKWLMTTDAWLAQDRWLMYFRGSVSERPLFELEQELRTSGEAEE